MDLLGSLVDRNREPRVGLYVDGPNVFRDEFDVDLDELRSIAGEGVRTVAIAPGAHGRSDALQNTAQRALTLGEYEH